MTDIVKSFWRGFREGWANAWKGESRYSINELMLFLLFWEWIHGRLL